MKAAVVQYAPHGGFPSFAVFTFSKLIRLLAPLTIALPALATAAGSEAVRQPTSFAKCLGFFLGQKPPALTGRPNLRELCFESFAVLHSGDTRTPVYAAQRLNARTLGGVQRQRSDRFFADARLPLAERATLEDYKRSGYSRGHLAPAGDMATEEAMAQSFSLANVVPQSIRHNSGAWSKIEQDTRADVFNYIEMFYNPKRRHGTAGDTSPVEFERRHSQRLTGV